jgi:hypothetical protein
MQFSPHDPCYPPEHLLPLISYVCTRTPKATTPARFADYLAEWWAEGHKSARHLLPELKARSYAGSQTHLERLLGQWRRADHAGFLRDLAGGSTTYPERSLWLPLPQRRCASSRPNY